VLDYATGFSEPFFFVDADMYSGNMILTAPLSALGLAERATFDFSVTSDDNYFTGTVSKTLGPMAFMPDKPTYQVAGGPTQAVAGGAATSPSQKGLLLLYRGNAGSEADVIVAR